MKKWFLNVFALLMLINVQAQTAMPGLYIKTGIGYTFPLAGQTLDNNGLPFYGNVVYQPSGNYPPVVNAFDARKVSFSSGFQAVLSLGYMFSKYIGLEIEASGVPSSINYDAYFYNAFNPSGANRVTEHDTRKLNFPFFITPSLVFNTGDNKKFSCYARGGVVMPVITKMTEEQTYDVGLSGSEEYVKQETKMKFGIGFSGSMGVKYNASPVFSIWAELNMQALSLYADQTTVTDHTVDGGNPPPQNNVPVVGTVTKYASTGNYSATLKPLYSIPFSNMGLRIGVMLKLKQVQTAEPSGKK